jgi:hypothetical protein
MKKLTISFLTLTAMILSPALRADVAPANDAVEIPMDADTGSDVSPREEGTPVGQASNEGSKAAKKQTMYNIALAVVAIGVAIGAMILVSSNDGHHHHHHHHH